MGKHLWRLFCKETGRKPQQKRRLRVRHGSAYLRLKEGAFSVHWWPKVHVADTVGMIVGLV